jgi:hypothetical protein
MNSLATFLPTRWWSPRAWHVWMSYVHWRLETYGVYYPAGKFSWNAFTSLLKQASGYRRWLTEMERLRKQSPKTH